MARIQSPVIDRSVTAFPCTFQANKDILRIYFYFSSLELSGANINQKYILARILESGKTVFSSGANVEPFIVWHDGENLITNNRYYIDVPTRLVKDNKFHINTNLSISLQALSNNIITKEGFSNFFNILQNRIWHRDAEDYLPVMAQFADLLAANKNHTLASDFSRSVTLYPIAKPKFITYGGLTDADIVDRFVANTDEQKLSEFDTDQQFNPTNDYIFKSVLDVADDVYQGEDIENDFLDTYEVLLIGHNGSTKNRVIQVGNQLVTANQTRVEVENSGEAYLDTDWDPSRKSFYYRLKHDFLNSTFTQYELMITYYTQKGYCGRHSYFIRPETVSEEADIIQINPHLYLSHIDYIAHPEKGSITVDMHLKFTDRTNSFLYSGTLLLDRAEDVNYGKTAHLVELQWETIYQEEWTPKLSSQNGYKASRVIDDMTAEPGKLYFYRVRFKYWDPSRQAQVFARGPEADAPPYIFDKDKRVILMLEDSFLATRDLTLKVRYNPDLGAYKRNVVDIVTPTLGGAYPFVRRNGAQRYRTFTIGGLISYNSELYESKEWHIDSSHHPIDEIPNEFYNSLFIKTNGKNAIDTEYYNAMVSNGLITKEDKRIIYEKLFRDMVLEFLYDDQVILFKSQPEGNIFVRLSNVQFTPDKQLDRHIYSFTATATEVLEANSANYLEYFSPGTSAVDYSLQNIYLVAGYYDYEAKTLYVGEGDIGEDIIDIMNVPPVYDKDGNFASTEDTLDLHLEVLESQSSWEG